MTSRHTVPADAFPVPPHDVPDDGAPADAAVSARCSVVDEVAATNFVQKQLAGTYQVVRLMQISIGWNMSYMPYMGNGC